MKQLGLTQKIVPVKISRINHEKDYWDGEVITEIVGYYARGYDIMPKIKKVIFSDPYTIIIWEDNTKTKVKAIDQFDEYNGLCIAVAKKVLGSNTKIKRYVENATRQKKEPSVEDYENNKNQG